VDLQQRYRDALDGLLPQLKEDRSILAAVLCGSLAYDAVWAGSDIDLVLVTIDDKKVPPGDRSLYVDDVNVHAFLMPRSEFRKAVEGSVRNSFLHTLLARGKLLYTHDPTIADLCAGLSGIGRRDTELQLLRAATAAVAPIYKAHKFLSTRGDLEYTALFLLQAATPLAKIEVIGARRIADREVIPQALKLNPAFFGVVYTDLLNTRKTPASVTAALDAVDAYLAERAPALFAPVLEHLREAGEARSATEIEDHFTRNFGIEGVTAACEYLADQGLVGKSGISVQLTRKSNVQVQELAFFPVERLA
jgi:predicted nucleotidyltransferase